MTSRRLALAVILTVLRCGGAEVDPADGLGDEAESAEVIMSDALQPCVTLADCPEQECFLASCASGRCAYVARPKGSPCDDGRACTAGDHCDSGACVPDEDLCGPACDSDAECAAHEDGDRCNGVLKCSNGACALDASTVVECPLPESPCRVARCDPASGACSEAPAEDGAQCDDGSPCTQPDACEHGECRGLLSECDCDEDLDCSAWDEPCKDRHACDTSVYPSVCLPVAGSAVTCALSIDPCRPSACDPVSGECAQGNALDGTACNDGDPCTQGDACAEGKCVAGQHAPCDDGNWCTLDYCEALSGACSHELLSNTACPAFDACHEEGECQAGVCLVGAPLCPADQDPCTLDTCDPATGACRHEPSTGPGCDDGDACTIDDACFEGQCSGHDVVCPAEAPCQKGTCDPATGECLVEFVAALCDDHDACTTGDHCQAGECVVEVVQCPDDDNPCTLDGCDQQTGACFHLPRLGEACDDLDNCTLDDACDGQGACTGIEVDCNDHDACTTGDHCVEPLFCVHGTVDCSDSDQCTADYCDPSDGSCSHEPREGEACNDGDPCTEADACLQGECLGGPKDCSALEGQCYRGVCEAGTGHCIGEFTPGVACDDADACTRDDVCELGKCAGTVDPCDQGGACTHAECLVGQGCVYTSIEGCCGNQQVEPPEECDPPPDATGVPCVDCAWVPFVVNTYVNNAQRFPAVAWNEQAQAFLVAWQTDFEDAHGQGVAAALIGADGAARGAPVLVPREPAGDQWAPRVVARGEGFVVGWVEAQALELVDVGVSAEGPVVTSPSDFAIASERPVYLGGSADLQGKAWGLALDGVSDRLALVHSQDDGTYPQVNHNVHLTLVGRNRAGWLTVLQGPQALVAEAGSQTCPVVASSGGGFFAAWATGGGVSGRPFSSGGVVGSMVTLVSPGATPHLAPSASGYLGSASGTEWRARAVNLDGSTSGAAFAGGTVGKTGMSPAGLALPGLEAGSAVLAWHRLFHPTVDSTAIFVQRVERDPVSGVVTPQPQRELSEGNGRAMNPALAASTPGGPVLVVWEEEGADGSSWGILARLVQL